MDQVFNLTQSNKINMKRQRGIFDKFQLNGCFDIQHVRNGIIINSFKAYNDIVNEGKNKIFNVMFNDDAQIANNSWFIGLISAAGFSSLPNTDTMANHPGWSEFSGYTQATRVPWNSSTSIVQSVSNPVPAVFNFNTTATLKGIFISSNNVKNGVTGILWSTALLPNDTPVTNGDELRVSYTVNA